MANTQNHTLGHNLRWDTLHQLKTLQHLDDLFLKHLKEMQPALAVQLELFRANNQIEHSSELSEFLVNIAEKLDDFIIEVFQINKEYSQLKKHSKQYSELYKFRRHFVQRHALHKYPNLGMLSEYNIANIYNQICQYIDEPYTDERFALCALQWLAHPEQHHSELHNAEIWAAYNALQPNASSIFNATEKIDYCDTERMLGCRQTPNIKFEYDKNYDEHHAHLHTHYCLSCHKQSKDSCRLGIINKQSNKFSQNSLGNILAGCPLDQKISEMITAAREGNIVSALAIAMIDNPLIALTGHRICNDCSKSCIFQKQSHVDVPSIESEIFNDVINLPMGVEIYNLLLLWNPLNIRMPLPSKATGKNALIAGIGPSGISMAYYLLRSGHNVTAIDGLKLEPLDIRTKHPIKYWHEYYKTYPQLIADGFGGVAQYGITSRWEKNNLRIIRLILERFSAFKMFGSVMLGKTFTIKDAFENMGFDHICLAFGAGSPNIPHIDNVISARVWPAADFLMSINLQKPYLKNSTAAGMQIRLPLVVIGAGLTAVDSAVEAVKYYIAMVEKVAEIYHAMDDPHIFSIQLSAEHREILQEYLEHAELLKNSRNKLNTIKELGGVKILYRKDTFSAPSYRLNHEELKTALDYGIEILENYHITSFMRNKYGAIESITATPHNINTRTALIATGTNHHKDPLLQVDSKYHEHISILGDMDPKYHGSVVKALASSKDAYPVINNKLNAALYSKSKDNQPLEELLTSKVVKVTKLANDVTELVIHSPAAAYRAKTGQFFKLQPLMTNHGSIIEPIALSPTKIDTNNGNITFILYSAGASSRACSELQVGDAISLMGPAGKALNITNKKLLIIGEHHLNNVLSQIIHSAGINKNNVTHLAFYHNNTPPHHFSEMKEKALFLSYDINSLKQTISQFLKQNSHAIEHMIFALSPQKLRIVQEVITLYAPCIKSETLLLTPMHCMMQGQCGRCVQYKNINSSSEIFFTCKEQYLALQQIDLDNASKRLYQNQLLESIATYCSKI